MFAVPGQQVIHAMNDRGRDVYRVNRGLSWHGSDTNQLLGKVGDLLCDVKQRELLQDLQPKTDHRFIPASRFIDHRLRGEEFEGLSSVVPPLLRDLLVSSGDQIPAQSSRQVTDNRC